MKNKINQSLGKGIDALIKKTSNSGSNLLIEIEKIIPNQKNPRKIFDKTKLDELKESIYQHGILQPLTARLMKSGRYEIIAGGRRFEALKQLSEEYEDKRFRTVPLYIREISTESSMTELALIENIQRSNLNPIEEARAYQDLKLDHNMTDQQIADKIGKSRSFVTNSIRLLSFDKSEEGRIILKALESREVSAGQIRPLIDLKPITQITIFKKIRSRRLSSRQVEMEVKNYKNLGTESSKGKSSLESFGDDQKASILKTKLSNHLENKIDIKINKNGSGKVVIHFGSDRELKDIVENKILK